MSCTYPNAGAVPVSAPRRAPPIHPVRGALRYLRLGLLLGLSFAVAGCANLVANSLGNVLAEDSLAYAADEDIQLVGTAIPFGLKTMESLLQEVPRHRPLLAAAARGFTQYAYVYVQLPADELEERDVEAAYAEWGRARRLYLRARDYGLRSLGIDGPAQRLALYRDPRAALAPLGEGQMAALYWTALAWSAAISLGKDQPRLVAELPIVAALVERAMQIDADFDAGGLHTFLIAWEMGKPGAGEAAPAIADAHFRRALALSDGQQAAPYVSMAEAVAAPGGDRPAFERYLRQALAVDADARPEWRLANHVMQNRARWLLSRRDLLFLE